MFPASRNMIFGARPFPPVSPSASVSPTPPPDLIITYSGARSGTWNLETQGDLNLKTVGSYTFTFSRSATIHLGGLSGGSGGDGGSGDSNPADGGAGGGGGATQTLGAHSSTTVGSTETYTGLVGGGGVDTAGVRSGGNTEFMLSGSTVYMRLIGAGEEYGGTTMSPGTVHTGTGGPGGRGGIGARFQEDEEGSGPDSYWNDPDNGQSTNTGGGGGGGGSNGNGNAGGTGSAPGGHGESGVNTSGLQGEEGEGSSNHPSGGASGGSGGGGRGGASVGYDPDGGVLGFYGGGGGGGGGGQSGGRGGAGGQGLLQIRVEA